MPTSSRPPIFRKCREPTRPPYLRVRPKKRHSDNAACQITTLIDLLEVIINENFSTHLGALEGLPTLTGRKNPLNSNLA